MNTFFTIAFCICFFISLPIVGLLGLCYAIAFKLQNDKLEIYFVNLLLGVDQFLNAVLGGDPDQGLSGRCGRALDGEDNPWFVKPLTKFVDYMAYVIAGEEDHCLNAVEPEELLNREIWKW